MKPKVYTESTIPSYLTGWASRDLLRATHQQLTREWWATREEFDLYVSLLILDECAKGDPEAAAERLAALEGLPILEEIQQVREVAKELMRSVWLPSEAQSDAVHIATAAVHRID